MADYYETYVILNEIFQACYTLAPSIFAIKYWVISKKIEKIMCASEQDETLTSIHVKALVIFYGQVVLIIASTTFYTILECETLLYIDYGAVFVSAVSLYCLPPYVVVFVIANAYLRLKKSGGASYSLSEAMILRLLVIITIFALSNTIFFGFCQLFDPLRDTAWYVGIALLCITSTFFTFVLQSVADIQLDQQDLFDQEY